MTNEEKRYDAAHTLGVSYDATPSAVDAAYLQRIKQYLNIQSDSALFIHKLEHLYDARIRMRMSPSCQWIANAGILMGSGTQRSCDIYRDVIKIIGSTIGGDAEKHAETLYKLAMHTSRLERERRILFISSIAGIFAMPGGDNVNLHLLWAAMMLGVGIRSLYVMDKQKATINQLKHEADAFCEQIRLSKQRENTK